MKAFKKAVLSCMAVGALSAMVATAAFADEITVDTATCEAGKITVTSEKLGTYTGQMTVLVISKEADDALAEGGTLSASDILYIDQVEDAAGIFQNMGARANYVDGETKDEDGNLVKGDGVLKDGDYVVKIGGDNVDTILTINFTVGGGTVVLGDVTGEGDVTADDLTGLARHLAKIQLITDPQLLTNADVTGEGDVTADDLTKLARFLAKIIGSLE